MKVIVAGATGFAGSVILERCIQHPGITSVLALVRRAPSPELAANPKVTVVIHDDFSKYPDALLQQLEGAEGCLWAIGGMVMKFKDAAEARKVGVEYTLAAATAFAEKLALRGKKFRFVFLSGWLAEHDAKKKLWMLEDSRRIKGDVEKGLLAVEQAHPTAFEVSFLRPGAILKKDTGALTSAVMGALSPAVKVNEVAAAMVDICLNGSKEKILENAEVVARGKKALKETPEGEK